MPVQRLIDIILKMSRNDQMLILENIEKSLKTPAPDEAKVEDLRRHERQNTFVAVDVEAGERKFTDFIDDISNGGMFIKTNTMIFFVGQLITMDFTWKDAEHINVKGQIVRVSGEGIGVKFIKQEE